MKKSIYIATSLDGFIARKNGELDWLMDEAYAEEGNDYGFAAFLESVSCLVMGRNTFEMVMSFDQWAYGDTRIVVMSRSLDLLPEGAPESVGLFSGSPVELVEKLESEDERHLYVDGGQLIQSFLREGLIDSMILTRMPVLIGSGIPLFGELASDQKFQHVQTRSFKTGLVQSEYQIKR